MNVMVIQEVAGLYNPKGGLSISVFHFYAKI
jgi:hypothetical protein